MVWGLKVGKGERMVGIREIKTITTKDVYKASVITYGIIFAFFFGG